MARYELNHDGVVLEAETALCANKDAIIDEMLAQYNHTVVENLKDGPYRKFTITDANNNTIVLNVFSGNIRNEARNPYEKKIQLNGKDPRPLKAQNTIIIGIYVFHANDSLSDVLIVGYPIDDNTNYDTNPSLRGTFVNKILQEGKNSGFCYDEETKRVCFRPEFFYYYLNNYKKLHYSEVEDTTSNIDITEPHNAEQIIGKNLLLYGVPGCGKSHLIETKICDGVDEYHKERVVFHPDYTYSDFVGQILPQSKEGIISYPFIPGPFTRIMQKAYSAENENEHFYLIIEEINRGNAPAIFGDIFQLLDREENGKSKFGITNADIASMVYGKDHENDKVYIPSNLTILATMNTADQNVFTLDTAFKRRWDMESIRSDFSKCTHARTRICGTNLTWEEFVSTINETIISSNEGNLSSEDNRLGAWFVKEADLHDTKAFSEKVLMYLWNDAFKFSRSDVFKSEYNTLEELIDGFVVCRFGVFADTLGFAEKGSLTEGEITEPSIDKPTDELSAEEYLEGKNEQLIVLYQALFDAVKSEIPDADAYTVPSRNYIGFKAPNINKRNFSDVSLQRDRLVLLTEKPNDTALVALGTELEYDGHKNHYFRLYIYNARDIENAVKILVESYNQLKIGDE